MRTFDVREFAYRLEIQCPGGLFGNVSVENIEDEHATGNARLMRMMEDMHLVENRRSGIKAMLRALRDANLEPPRFEDRRASFRLTFHNHTLMNPDAIRWLNQFSHVLLNDRQRLALVYLRLHQHIANPEYRRLNHVDPTVAGQELRGLIHAGLVVQHGAARWTSYTLKSEAEIPKPGLAQTEEDKIHDYVREHGSISNPECRGLIGLDLRRASYVLNRMVARGRLRKAGERRWARYQLP